MITDGQVCIACAAYDGADVAHSQLAAMRKALETYEQSKWVKFNIDDKSTFPPRETCNHYESLIVCTNKNVTARFNYRTYEWVAEDGYFVLEIGYENIHWQPLPEFNRNRDKYLALYTAPPTREPLSEEFLMALAEECTAQFFNGVHQNATLHFARAVEKAHGIGVTND